MLIKKYGFRLFENISKKNIYINAQNIKSTVDGKNIDIVFFLNLHRTITCHLKLHIYHSFNIHTFH